MNEKTQSELMVEILDQAQEWERDLYIQSSKSQGRNIHVLSLADSIPPKDNVDGTWLDIKTISDAVGEKIRELYPRFLYEIVKDTGLMDISVLDKKLSLYWLMPISEMSVLRNPLIDKIHALFVLKEVLKGTYYQRVFLVTDDALLEKPVRELCKQFNVKNFEIKIINSDKPTYYRSYFSLFLSWCIQLLPALTYWFTFNFFNIGKFKKVDSTNVLGLTVFPTLWSENTQGVLENLAFGDFPTELKKHDRVLNYLAIPTMKIPNLLMNLKYWQRVARESNVFFTYTLLSLQELLAVYFRHGWGRQLSKWFKKFQSKTFYIDSLEISDLVVREFQHELWNQGLLNSFILACASEKSARYISTAVCAFEFQPIEKAFVAGIKKINSSTKIIGLQTSLLGKSHLGYYFLSEQMNQTNELIPPFAPLPDYVAAYGNTTYNMLTKKFIEDRVSLTGPIRYPYLKLDSQTDRDHAEKKWKDSIKLNGEDILILLALPSLKQEALSIMEWAFSISSKYPQLYFLVRFHYWAVLTEDLKKISQTYSVNRYQIADGDLHELLLASRFIITGTSSVGIEAMVSGCMPVSYKPTRKYDFGRVQDVEEGAFFYTNKSELQTAIHDCVLQNDKFMEKKSRWANLIQRLCNPLDGKASSRFYEWLNAKGVFGMKETSL